MIEISPRELAHFAIQLGAMQKPEEFESLITLLGSHFNELRELTTIVEIGAGNGGTSWAWSKLGASKLIVIDLPNGPWGGTDIMPMMEYIKQSTSTNLDVILGNSQNSECLAALKERLGDSKVDFLFIDGAHDYAGVKSDFLTYSPFLRSGGILALHDVVVHPPETQCEVHKFWAELKEAFASKPAGTIQEFISKDGGDWAGIGAIRWP